MLRKILLGVILAEVIGLLFFQFSFPFSAQASSAVEAARIAQVCEDVAADRVAHEKCVAGKFADIGEKMGVAFIGEVLSSYQTLNSGYQGYQNCHVLAHRIMNDLGAREPEGWKELLGEMSAGQLDPTRCGGGFMHGALEVRAAEDPSFKVGAPLFHEICTETLPFKMSTSCAHILGHLALIEALGSLTEALKACDGLSGDFLFQCYGGIFMEDSMRTNLEVHGLAELPERNLAWLSKQRARCDRYKAEPMMARGCWYDLTEVFLQNHHYDIVQTYRFCTQAPNKEARDDCSIRGSYLTGMAPDFLFKSFPNKELCSIYESGTRELSRCMNEVIGAQLTGSMSFLDRSISFCSFRPEEVQRECFNSISHNISWYSAGGPSMKHALCGKLPEAAQDGCLKLI